MGAGTSLEPLAVTGGIGQFGSVVHDPRRFQSATLALIGHGSSKNAESRMSVLQHAATLRQRGLFGRVLSFFYREEPWVKNMWETVTEGEIFAIPVFMGDGYFTQVVIPRELGFPAEENPGLVRVLRRGHQVLRYGRAVGTHSGMTAVVLARAEEITQRFPGEKLLKPEETGLVIAGHGTQKHDRSRDVIDHQVEIIRGMGRYAEVHAAFMEEELRIGDCYEFVRAPNMVVVPYFVGDGMHVQEDIPVLLGEAETEVRARLARGEATWHNPTIRHGKQVWYTGSVGLEPLLADVILERVEELIGRRGID